MRVYTVHLRRHGLDGERDLVLVKEGFSWPAFFVAFLWALWHRLWLFAAALVVVAVSANGLAYLVGADTVAGGVISVGIAVAVGWIANDVRRRALEKRGFAFVGAASGKNRDEAVRRFLDDEPELARQIGIVGAS